MSHGFGLLKAFVSATLLGVIASNLATHWTPSSQQAGAWGAHANRYCCKNRCQSVPLFADPTDVYGFNFSQKQCQDACDENTHCKFYSYGLWTKGTYKFFPKMRCQTYLKCEMKESIEGTSTSVFEKPDGAINWAALMVMAAVAVVILTNYALVLQSDYIGTQGPSLYLCSSIAVAFSAYLIREAGSTSGFLWTPELWTMDYLKSNTLFLALAVFHILNCLGLLGVVRAAKSQAEVLFTGNPEFYHSASRPLNFKPVTQADAAKKAKEKKDHDALYSVDNGAATHCEEGGF